MSHCVRPMPPGTESNSEMAKPVSVNRTSGRITRGRLASAVSSLDAVSVRLGGLIINDLENPTLGQRVAASALKMPLLTKRLSTWLAAKANSSDALNTPL